MKGFRVATCSLNQLAQDYDGNQNRIIQSIQESIDKGAVLRVGPELEITGYGCDDAFFELDTTIFSWEVLENILKCQFKNILIDVGMPVIRNSNLYNCRILILNSKILLIRPKTKLAGNGIYREERWFVPWDHSKSCLYELPPNIQKVTGQKVVPFSSNAVIQLFGISGSVMKMGFEICEELWRPDASHIELFGEQGCHLICNSSGGYWEIRKLDLAWTLMKSATLKCGGAYTFANMLGMDGGRTCYYGRSLIAVNGKLLNITGVKSTDIFQEVQVALGDIFPDEIDSYRLRLNMKKQPPVPCPAIINFDPVSGYEEFNIFPLSGPLTIDVKNFEQPKNCEPVLSQSLQHMSAPEELKTYGSLWLWDYLRKCPGFKGFILPLSGGIDSSSVACLVYCMCDMLQDHIRDPRNITDRIKKLLDLNEGDPTPDAKAICSKLLRCVYLASEYSGSASQERASNLAKVLGAEFLVKDFRGVYQGICTLNDHKFEKVGIREQNLQARIRMILTYDLSEGRLVLSSGNVDEALVGYLTKYDCSSGDLNPIGSISKQDLRGLMEYFRNAPGIEEEAKAVLDTIISATPSAELTGESQSDEEDMGLTYEQLGILGRFRRGELGCYGPFLMFQSIWERRHLYPQFKDVQDLATRIKRFFELHAKNRHKMTVITPSLHAETYSPDDNRYDHRQFVFDCKWTFQFRKMDEEVEKILKNGG